MDIGLPGLNGLEAARRIDQLVPSSKIIFLTQESSPEVIEEAARAGACGYVLKSEVGTDLLAAIDAVLQVQQFFQGRVGGPEPNNWNGQGQPR
jgi:DNA-binding NarL/FixJ family response regulator